MELAGLIIAFAVLVVSGVAAAAAVVQARAANRARADSEIARDQSRTARDEAAELARVATAAFVRQAEAQEEGNRIARASLPKIQPKISLRQVGNDRWMATNTGDVTAYDAQIIVLAGYIHLNDNEPRDLHIGDSLYFNVLSASGDDPRIRIRYEHRPDDGEPTVFQNDITLP